jgi:hypothetical protein
LALEIHSRNSVPLGRTALPDHGFYVVLEYHPRLPWPLFAPRQARRREKEITQNQIKRVFIQEE